MIVGYARVSTRDQEIESQLIALRAAGCSRIFSDVASGARSTRVELAVAFQQLRPNDVLVVWKLDRLARSLSDLLHNMQRLRQIGAGFRSLTENIDTTTPQGRMMMHMVGAFAEFELALLKERTRAGLETARSAGRIGGRRSKLLPHQWEAAAKMLSDGMIPAEVARTFNVHRSTITRNLHKMNPPTQPEGT